MSFINYKEKVFCKNNKLHRISGGKKKSINTLSFINPSTDPRSWSIDLGSQRDYIIDAFCQNTSATSSVSECSSGSSSHSTKSARSSRVGKIKRNLKGLRRKCKPAGNSMAMTNTSTEKLLKSLNNANERINQLANEKEEAETSAKVAKDEVENLRKLVKDVQEELSSVQKLKLENLKLKSELNVDYRHQLQEAQDEINHLSAQLDIFKNYQNEYNCLKESYNKLKEEYNSLNVSLVKCSSDNSELKREIDEYKGTICRDMFASNAIVDREVLRQRIHSRDDKINFLISFLEEQELTISDLAIQLERLTTNVSAKEILINKHMSCLKCTLEEKKARIIYLEDKLHNCELLLRELETGKETLRLANATINENMITYKSEFNSVVHCCEKLLQERQICEEQLRQRDEQIMKLSIFPASPKTVVYLSQMLHILNKSEKSASDDTDTIFSYISPIRNIIEQMKWEVWNADSVNLITDLESSHTQTDNHLRENFSQHETFYCCSHKYVEANIPDKFYFENQNLRNDISEMRTSIAHLEDAYFTKSSLNKELEKKLICIMDEKMCKEKEMSELEKELELAEEKQVALQEQLDVNNSLLNKALAEIDIEQQVRESTSQLFSLALESTLNEYSTLACILQIYITQQEEKIESLQNYLNEEMQSKTKFDEEYVSKLENEIKRLTQANVKEKENVQELNSQISVLQKQLSDKKNKFKTIQSKLEQAERLFEQINKLDSSQNVAKYKAEEVEMDQMVLVTSNKILMYGESLGNHWKEEKHLKEKLLKESFSQSYVKKILKNSSHTIKKLKIKIKELSDYIIKTKKGLNKKRTEVIESAREISNCKLVIDQLKRNYEQLSIEKEETICHLSDKMKEVEELKYALKARTDDYEALKHEKEKMEKVLNKIMGNLEQSLSGQKKESIGTITDVEKAEEQQIKNLTSTNKELSAVITQLQERLDSLLYVPQKEGNPTDIDLFSVSVQVNMDCEKEKLKQLEMHYQNLIKSLQSDSEKERELLEKENIEKCEAHKRNLKLLMKTLQENIGKMQEDHSGEISQLKSTYDKELKTLISRLEDEEKNKKLELDEQRKHYECILINKDEELNKGINELRIEIQNIISSKEDTINKIKEVAKIHVNYIKKKYKKSINKVKNELKGVMKKYDELKKASSKLEVEKADVDSQTDISQTKHSEHSTQTNSNYKTCDRLIECLISEPKADMESQTIVAKLRHVQANTDESIYTKDQGKQLIPEKMDHIIFGLPPNKNIDINYKESIKCSIKEMKRTFIGELYTDMPSLASGDATIRDIFYQRDKHDLITHIERLENDLTQKTEDFNRNVIMYQETIRRLRCKVKDLEACLNQESLETLHIQHRLGLEFTRAEQLEAERSQLMEYCQALHKYIQEHELESNSEREKYNHLKKRYESILYQRKQADQLDESLKRLKEKLERAVEYEKRLTEEIQEEKKAKEKYDDIINCNAIDEPNKHIEDEKESKDEVEIKCNDDDGQKEAKANKPMNMSDLKVVFIQQCEFRRMWSRQILEKKYHHFKENFV